MAEHAEFVTLYASELADLTFNSKPVINTLTMLAAENAPAAHSIASAIERHIVTARRSAVSQTCLTEHCLLCVQSMAGCLSGAPGRVG
jgi:hypothetical protein